MPPSRLIFDSETDGHLYEFTKFHCICTKDVDTLETRQYRFNQIPEALEHLSSYDMLIGHNICGFDIPAIKKLYPRFSFGELRDSLCMSRLFDPERPLHGLEDYGEQFGRHKPVILDWKEFSEEKVHRCSEDVEINHLTYSYLVDKYCKTWSWLKSLKIEQDFCLYRAGQILEGVDIDEELARKVLKQLDEEIEKLDAILMDKMPRRIAAVGNVEVGNKPFKKNGEYTAATREWFEL